MHIALLLLVHGSPKSNANDPIKKVLEDIRARGEVDIAELGYLECNDPDIPAVLEQCVTRGAERVICVPCFLHPGNHVINDIPEILCDAGKKHPEVEFLLTPFLGSSPQITEILMERARQAQSGRTST